MTDHRSQLIQHVPRLRRYARALTGERAAADDLVQDTLERALNKFHLWRHGSDLRAWLFTVMHNIYVNQVRARAADRLDFSGEELRVPALQATAIERLEMRDIESALRRLPEDQRAVVLLVGLEQFSYEEAARALRIPVGTVMSRLARGRERLRTMLSDTPPAAALKAVK
jgi:RNA polymerase sigma-70 factor (ECF subfamily)